LTTPVAALVGVPPTDAEIYFLGASAEHE